MTIVILVMVCTLAQLMAITISWMAFAAADPVAAMDLVSEAETEDTVLGNMLAWPGGVWKMLRVFPLIALVDAGGYIAMLWFFGPGVAVAVFVLCHIVAQLMVKK